MEITIFFIIFNTILGIANMYLYYKINKLPILLAQAFLWITVGMQIGKLTFYYFR